jgi:hypothetical protein
MSSSKTIPAIASNEYEFNGVVKFCFSLTDRSGRPTPKLSQQFGRIDSHWFSALKI